MQPQSLIYPLCLSIMLACNLIDGKGEDPGPQKKTSKEMSYSYACLDSAVGGSDVNKAISKSTDLIRRLAVKEKDITDAVQTEYGNAFHQDAIETKTFVLLEDAAISQQLAGIMNELLAKRESPSAIKYSIYLIDDKEINAFTFGGHIYITKAMYDKCKGSIPLLYSIIGHEIGHSEKGHIRKTIQEMKIAENIFGEERGTTAFQVMKLLTGSFNQKNELEADYYGTDLAYRLDQDVCAAATFWKEMSEKENEYNRLEDFFRTHPFSSLRYQCLKNHIQTNFGRQCP
jgi:beta-barrel assembly-enhancing protease